MVASLFGWPLRGDLGAAGEARVTQPAVATACDRARDRRRDVSTPVASERGPAYTPDVVTTTEDLSGSPLWNPDLAPTPPERRTWSTYNIAALWIGMSVVITTYTLASGLMSQGMTWWQAMLVILLGNVIVLVPMVLNAHAGTRYGISFPVLCRASFGVGGVGQRKRLDGHCVRHILGAAGRDHPEGDGRHQGARELVGAAASWRR